MEKEPVTLELLQLNRGWAYNYCKCLRRCDHDWMAEYSRISCFSVVVSVFMVCDTFWTLPREVRVLRLGSMLWHVRD